MKLTKLPLIMLLVVLGWSSSMARSTDPDEFLLNVITIKQDTNSCPESNLFTIVESDDSIVGDHGLISMFKNCEVNEIHLSFWGTATKVMQVLAFIETMIPLSACDDIAECAEAGKEECKKRNLSPPKTVTIQELAPKLPGYYKDACYFACGDTGTSIRIICRVRRDPRTEV